MAWLGQLSLHRTRMVLDTRLPTQHISCIRQSLVGHFWYPPFKCPVIKSPGFNVVSGNTLGPVGAFGNRTKSSIACRITYVLLGSISTTSLGRPAPIACMALDIPNSVL